MHVLYSSNRHIKTNHPSPVKLSWLILHIISLPRIPIVTIGFFLLSWSAAHKYERVLLELISLLARDYVTDIFRLVDCAVLSSDCE